MGPCMWSGVMYRKATSVSGLQSYMDSLTDGLSSRSETDKTNASWIAAGECVRRSSMRGIMDPMTVRRVVPNLLCSVPVTTREFYVDLLGFEVVMDLGWIVTVASPSNPTAQISLFHGDPGPPVGEGPALTIEVLDVDAVHATAVAMGCEIVLSLRDEPWGARRFFIRDPDRRVVNVMCQPGGAE